MRKLQPEFDRAILGVALVSDGNRRRRAVAYSGDKMVKIVAKRDGCDEEDAAESIESEADAYVADGSPIIVWKEPDLDEAIADES